MKSKQEELKQETLEEAAEKYLQECRLLNNIHLSNPIHAERCKNNFIAGAKWQSEKMYSEDDLRKAYRWGTTVNNGTKEHFNEWLKKFKKK